MASLTFPVTQAGLALPILIGLDGQTTTRLLATGQPIQPPISARGLLDTGTSVTSVAASVLQQLGLSPTASGKSQTASGMVSVRLFSVSLNITDPGRAGAPWLTHSDLMVAELTTSLTDADVLIGLDVLLECKLVLDGPGRCFTLEF
jgi:hypothetical protein